MEIRRAKPSDGKKIRAFDEIAQVEASRVAFIERSIKSNQCFVAVVDERVVGYGILNDRFYDHGFIDMVYVDRNLRRRGIGSALIRHMERSCRTAKLFTSTNRSNKPMQLLLNKLGYQRSGIIENLDEGDPEWVYVKRVRGDAL